MIFFVTGNIISYFRYLAGQKEYEVELQFSSGMLSYPDRVNTGGEEYRDGEYPVPGSLTDLHSNSEGSQQYVDKIVNICTVEPVVKDDLSIT